MANKLTEATESVLEAAEALLAEVQDESGVSTANESGEAAPREFIAEENGVTRYKEGDYLTDVVVQPEVDTPVAPVYEIPFGKTWAEINEDDDEDFGDKQAVVVEAEPDYVAVNKEADADLEDFVG